MVIQWLAILNPHSSFRRRCKILIIISKPKLLALFIIVLTVTVGWETYVILALPAPGRSSIVTPGGQTTPCSYDNYQDSGKFVGRNCQTGDNQFLETTANALLVDENVSNIARFWEPGFWLFGNVLSWEVNNVANVSDWGVYGR